MARVIYQQTNLILILPPSQLNNMFCLIVDQEPAKKVVVFTSVISLLHAVVNPPLYGWMSQRYRRGYLFVFKVALSVCGGTRPNRRSLSKFFVTCLATLVSRPCSSSIFIEDFDNETLFLLLLPIFLALQFNGERKNGYFK